MWKELAISIVGSLLVALFFYLIELLKRPKLQIFTDAQPLEPEFGGPSVDPSEPVARVKERIVRVRIANRKSRLGVIRNPARATHAKIVFQTESGQAASQHEMTGRWSSLRLPLTHLVPTELGDKGQLKTIAAISSDLFRDSEYIDVHSGESEMLEIAVKLDGDTGAFGWCNESLLNNHRHPNFSLSQGTHRAVIRLSWDSGTITKEIVIQDEGSLGTFFISSSK